MIPAKYGLYFPWGELSFTGNPYHPILATLFKWASSKRFYEQSFVDYCELKTKYRERNYILKLVEKEQEVGATIPYACNRRKRFTWRNERI